MTKKSGFATTFGLLIALPLVAAEPTPQPTQGETDTATLLAEFRDDLQAAETDIVSKVVSLSAEEASKFWPVFQKFQAEQKAIIDAQASAVLKYATDFEKLTDADALAYVQSLLERDQKIHDLRVKYLAEYSKVLPGGKAARVIHLSRRLGLASQSKLASAIPLVR